MSLRREVVPFESVVGDTYLLERWRTLALRAPSASFFQTPDWVGAWWQTIGNRPSGSAALIWDGDELVGFIALCKVREVMTSKVPLRVAVLTNAGTGIGTDHAGWLALDGTENELVDWLEDQRGVLLRGVPLWLGERLEGRLIDLQVCPRLEIAQVSTRMSSKLAKNLRNARRRLADEDVRFTWKAPGQVSQDDLDNLYRLHELRRVDAGDTPIFGDPMRRKFHEALLQTGDSAGGTAVLTATHGDQVVGVLYGFVWQTTFSYYQIGWDTAFRSLSLGSVLVLEAIEACSTAGLEIFDFLRGAEDYKYRFGATDVEEGSFVVGRSVGTTLVELAGNMRNRLRG